MKFTKGHKINLGKKHCQPKSSNVKSNVTPAPKSSVNPSTRAIGQLALERAVWLESTIEKLVPKWKLNILRRYNHPLLRRLLGADVQIISEELIADFGTRIVLTLNGKYVAERKFKL